jgi:hypothetical protein
LLSFKQRDGYFDSWVKRMGDSSDEIVTDVSGAVSSKMGGQAESETYAKFTDTILIQKLVYNS